MTAPEDMCVNGGDTHAWESTGLDNVELDRLSPRPNITLAPGFSEVLCSTRKCVWCRKEQAKPYGNGGRKPWRNVT